MTWRKASLFDFANAVTKSRFVYQRPWRRVPQGPPSVNCNYVGLAKSGEFHDDIIGRTRFLCRSKLLGRSEFKFNLQNATIGIAELFALSRNLEASP